MQLLRSLCLILLFAFVGCKSEKVVLVPVEGTVTIDGQPVGGIMAQFMPNVMDENVRAPTSQGLSNADGKFELFTLQNQLGAVEGPHRVSLFDTEEERPEQGQTATRPPRLDPKYANGEITVNVVKGQKVVLEATSPK